MRPRLIIYALMFTLLALSATFVFAQESTPLPTEEAVATQEAAAEEIATQETVTEDSTTEEAVIAGEAELDGESAAEAEAQIAAEGEAPANEGEAESAADLSTLMLVVGVAAVGAVGVLMINRDREENAA